MVVKPETLSYALIGRKNIPVITSLTHKTFVILIHVEYV